MTRFQKVVFVVLIVASATLAGMLISTRNALYRLQTETGSAGNQAFERAAVAAVAKQEKLSSSAVLAGVFPVTVELTDRVCVELRARFGWTDGGEVFCFDKRTRQVVEHYRPPI